MIFFQLGRIDRAENRFIRSPRGRNLKSCFGEPVTGAKRLRAKTTRLERLGESIQRFLAYGFGAVDGCYPTTEIQILALFGLYLSQAKLIGEVGGCAVRRFVIRN